MNWVVVLSLVVVMTLCNIVPRLRDRISMLGWVAIWWATIYLFLTQGFAAPLPFSIVREYMIIATLSLLVYVISDSMRWLAVKTPVLAFLTEKKFQRSLQVVCVLLPLVVGVKVYLNSQVEILAPGFSRSVHPAPPASISFQGKTIDLVRGENPLRALQHDDPEKFQEHLAKGRDIYYQNCFFCHGDAMQGDGHLAYGLDPIPTNFQDSATIGMLQESFLFWRIAKGGRGLPDEGAPWASAMPAWEDFLSEDDIWSVITYLYDYTGNKPRAVEAHHE
jgi:mono/diheme cytochrome c family protein